MYNDKFGINQTVAELEHHKTNMNTKEKHIFWSILKATTGGSVKLIFTKVI